ncbi:GDP-mannose 4,6-dehydratase [Candidatus Pelagibacter ubique]|uniref:GDP-mannose 4,6-dehydratase n=1 Tax=Pelagibacter ubique TaxID=198252 RepID=UPI0003C7E9F1
MKKVLITGALGQDGIILSKIFQKKNFEVYGFIEKKRKRKITKVKYNFNDLTIQKKIINHLKIIRPNIIIHLASKNETYKKRKNEKNYKINYLKNLKCTTNLLNSIIKVNLRSKLIFAGSSLMFKDTYKKVSEKTTLKSNDYYGNYKIDAHKMIMRMKNEKKIDASTAILFNHDSIFRNKKFLLPRIVKSFVNKDFRFIKDIYKLNINGDFSHAEDICNGIYKLSITKKEIDMLILSSGRRFYINKVINYLEQYFQYNIKKECLNKDVNRRIIGSNRLAKKILNYKSHKSPINVCKEILKNYL